MNRFETLTQMVERGNGYLLTADVVSQGISKPTLAEYAAKYNMERVAQGVYLSADSWPDELYQIFLLNQRIIYSHESALFLHGLMEREPRFIHLSVPAGYNATHLRKRGFHVYQIKKDLFEIGRQTIITGFGNTVPVYDRERTICDMIRYKESTDVQIFQYALKEYMRSNKKNLNNLMEYAEHFGIVEKVRTYTEVML